MRIGIKPFVVILAAGMFSAGLKATIPDSSAHHYAEVPERNAFGLKPPQKPLETIPPRPLPKIVLTGITTILGNKRALMKTQPVAGKPGEQAKELSLILAEGQRDGDIEVLQIDEKTGSVKVNNSGTVMTLTFERDATSAPPPSPAGPPAVTAGIPVPLTNPAIVNPALTNLAGMHPVPARNFRLPASQPVATPANGQAAVFQPPVGAIQPPNGVVPMAAVISQPSDLTPEEQAILQQVEREAASSLPQVVSNLPPLGSAPASAPVLPQ
jgi:hypothetical protein